ncbi:unnamed protein product [Schistosoma turkestanicum]|nr:unnamed protein product [Schistosoma turkestanicum]
MDAKKIKDDTNTFFGRFSQIVEEAFGTADRTMYSTDLTELIQESEKRRNWAVSILAQIENVIQPNPALRIEDFILKGMNREKVRVSANEQLGESMDRISSLINKNSHYGSSGEALKKCATAQIEIGQSERKLQETVSSEYIAWLRCYIASEAKLAKQERDKLENARLDLDRIRTSQKRAKSNKQNEFDRLLKDAESAFSLQCETTKRCLQQSIDKFDSQKEELTKLLKAQSEHFRACSDAVESALRAM